VTGSGRRWPAALVAALLAASPRVAEACAVCFASRDAETQAALIYGTVLLSVLPLLLVGGIALFLRRRARQLAVEEAARALPAAPSRARIAS
jgi:hypothetical protein